MFSSKRRVQIASCFGATLLVALTFGVLIYAVPVSGSAVSTLTTAATWDPSLGWDFECHTNTHPSLITLSNSAIIAELQAVNTAYQAHGYPPPQHMAYPYGDYDSRVESVVSQYRKSARTVSDYMTTYPVTNWYELNAAQLVATTTMNDITSWVTQCISTKSLLVIFTHDISANPSEYGCTATMLAKLLDYLVQQQNAGNIVVMTMAQAYDYWNNPSTQPKPTVVVSFDDANESDYLVAYPLFQARGLKGTSYIVTGYIDEQDQLSWAEIAKMRAKNTNCAVHLESKQNTNATGNTGNVTFNGTSYTLPTNIIKIGGNYKAQYYPISGYTFDHWETTGALTVASATTNPTSVTVNGNGTLRAIYKTATTYTFTDGFESGNFNAWTGTSGTPQVVGTKYHEGSYSALFNPQGTYEYSYKTLSSAQSTIYDKCYFLTDELPKSATYKYDFMRGYASGSAIFQAAILNSSNGALEWSFNYRSGATWTEVNSATATIFTNTWYCVELYWKQSATGGEVHLYINGVDVASVTGKNTNSYGPCDTIRNGVSSYSGTFTGPNVYEDSVAVKSTYMPP